jgi:peptide/nickel transport system permease protein
MTRFLLRKATHALFLLLGVSMLAFLFSALAPGNYFDDMRLNPQISAEHLNALRAEYGVDQPLALRYARWAGAVLRGDLGFSFAYNAAVGPLLWTRTRNTLLLTGTATVLVWMIALPLGVWSAEKQGRPADVALSWATVALLIVPDLALALGLLVLAVRSGWLPTGGLASVGFDGFSALHRFRDVAWHIVLPVLVLVASALPVLLRHVRAAVAESLEAPFLRAAEGHGISRGRLLYRYALPAAAHPLIALFGFSVGTLLSASLLVEVVMSWPGLGPFLLEAILARDLYVVIGAVLLSTVFLVAGNFLGDLLLYWADPRIRVEAGSR